MAVSRPAPAAPLLLRLRRRLRAYRWRRLALLAGASLAFGLALVGYLYGFESHFWGRLFSAFVVIFWLLAFTFLLAVPFVGWAAANWFGRGWSATAAPGPRARRPAAPPAARRRPPVRVPTATPESYS